MLEVVILIIAGGMGLITISLCMILRDEEETLGRCLQSVHDLVEEIIIVDTGSIDKTKAIALEFGAKIYDFEWIDDFSAARNYSFSKASQEYIFWLDADDVMLEEDRKKFIKLKATLDPRVDVVMMRYNLGVDEEGNAASTYYRERLLKRVRNFRWNDPIHEYMILKGNIINTDIGITHKKLHGRSSRNLNIFEKMISEGKELSHRNYFYYARELFRNGYFDEAIKYYTVFLDKEGGLMANYVDASIDMYNCYRIKNDDKSALMSLFRSFEHDVPHAEICCQLGYHFKRLREYKRAVYWFEQASEITRPENSWGSIAPDCYDYIPFMELCSCYYRLGDIVKAVYYNRQAAECRPNDPLVQHNVKYLENIVQSQKAAQ